MSKHNASSTTADGPETGIDPAQARVYRLLGELYLEPPDADRIDLVTQWAAEWRRQGAGTLPAAIETALEAIETADPDESDRLRTAFTHLFRGISESESPEPPYESIYRDGHFHSETTAEIRQGYRWAGLDVARDGDNEPADHLGVELQFLAELCEGTRPETGEDDPSLVDAQWWLLDEHLTGWVPAFAARVRDCEPPAFYAGVIDVTEAVVDDHHRRLQQLR